MDHTLGKEYNIDEVGLSNSWMLCVRATPGTPKRRLAKSVLHDQNGGNGASHVLRAFTPVDVGGNPERTDWGSVPAVYTHYNTGGDQL